MGRHNAGVRTFCRYFYGVLSDVVGRDGKGHTDIYQKGKTDDGAVRADRNFSCRQEPRKFFLFLLRRIKALFRQNKIKMIDYTELIGYNH